MLLPVIISAQSRTEIGLKLNFHSDDTYFKTSYWQDGRFQNQDYFGFEIGPLVRQSVYHALGIQSGVNFGLTGITSVINLKYKSSSPSSLMTGGRSWYGKVPIMLMYKFDVGSDSTFSLTFSAGGNLYYITQSEKEVFSGEKVDEFDSIHFRSIYQGNKSLQWSWAVGIMIENQLSNGNIIALNTEFRIGRKDLATENVNYSIYDKDYVALLGTSGPTITAGLIYYWGLGQNSTGRLHHEEF
jgi:hypothetical protein